MFVARWLASWFHCFMIEVGTFLVARQLDSVPSSQVIDGLLDYQAIKPLVQYFFRSDPVFCSLAKITL